MTNGELIERAASVLRPKKVGEFMVGDVGAALVAHDGTVHTGVCIDLPSAMGFCAEFNAAGNMVTSGEYRLRKVVAVWRSPETSRLHVAPPCGKCRQFLAELHEGNIDAEIVLSEVKSVKLRELLPQPEWEPVD